MSQNNNILGLPPQQLPLSKKNKEWRKRHLDWADKNSYLGCSSIRNTIRNKKINYDLLNGILHMEDLMHVLNPEGIKSSYTPTTIQHYPIMNAKLNMLRGEEAKRTFEYKVIVTNPNSITEIEEEKKNQVYAVIQEMIQNSNLSEEEMSAELEKLNEEFTYNWQDLREIRANELLNHYSKELDFTMTFNEGFMDALTVGEEIYQCDIVGGEPTLVKLNPLKVKVFRSGSSNRIEDADIITIEDYWSIGKVIDHYHEELTPQDRKMLESGLDNGVTKIDETDSFLKVFNDKHRSFESTDIFKPTEQLDALSPYDTEGNVRVLKVFWKSRRKIKKIKRYNPETGEEEYELMPETYITNTDMGEEEKIYYINEAWEGVKIGEHIYICMRPRAIQYNRLSNPSKCHFGIIGQIYNINDSKPFSFVDMMKSYNYLYDVTHHKLNKMLDKNWGKIITLDLAKKPENWDVDKWLHYARVAGISVVNSFKEGNVGAAKGILAGGLNNNTSGVIDAEMGNSIQSLIQVLEYIKNEMSEVVGISKQREGQISNRETVGGVERATLQSSHITEWIFLAHENLKKRVIECFLETAKIALRGDSKKFQYVLSDYSRRILDIDGESFAESDYGILVETSSDALELNQKLDMLAQAALQNQALSFSSIMQLYSSASISEKQNIIRRSENQMLKRQQEAQQQQMQLQQQELEQRAAAEQQKISLQDQLNARDNETKLTIARMQTEAQIIAFDGDDERGYNEWATKAEEAKDKIAEEKRQFDIKTQLEKEKLEIERIKAKKTNNK